MLAKAGSEQNQGPTSTYKPYANLNMSRRNFMVVEKNGTYEETNAYWTISFLFVNLFL